ncbi:MAG: TraB/GumN family protein [Pyrinomonadaceae bacterium]
MKRIVLTALPLFVVAATSIFVSAQSKTSASPSLLYQVTGNGITKPSYIFGTFHAVCASDMVPLESLDTYITQTDQLIMEIDMDDAAEMQSMAKAVVIPDGKTIKDLLTPEQFAKVDEMFKSLLGYSAENVKMVKPAMLTVFVLTSSKSIGCTPVTYDLSIMQNAAGKKKPIVGLETVGSQIKVIDSQPLAKQAKDLYEMALNPQKSIDELKQLMAVYKLRDPDKLYELTNRLMTDDKEFQARLLDERNTDWIPKLAAAFKEKPTFVAVGAGHLGGKKGVVNLLRKQGYKVEPVKL